MVIVSAMDILQRLDSFTWSFYHQESLIPLAVDFGVDSQRHNVMWLTGRDIAETIVFDLSANKNPIHALTAHLLAEACERLATVDCAHVVDTRYPATIAEWGK